MLTYQTIVTVTGSPEDLRSFQDKYFYWRPGIYDLDGPSSVGKWDSIINGYHNGEMLEDECEDNKIAFYFFTDELPSEDVLKDVVSKFPQLVFDIRGEFENVNDYQQWGDFVFANGKVVVKLPADTWKAIHRRLTRDMTADLLGEVARRSALDLVQTVSDIGLRPRVSDDL